MEWALVKWANPAAAHRVASLGSHNNPWLEPRLHRVGKCQVALAHLAAWAWRAAAPWVAAWAPQVVVPWAHRAVRWVAWA